MAPSSVNDDDYEQENSQGKDGSNWGSKRANDVYPRKVRSRCLSLKFQKYRVNIKDSVSIVTAAWIS